MSHQVLLVPLAEAAVRIGMAEKTARNWLSVGKFPIPTVKQGGSRLVRVADIESYVASLPDDTTPPAKPQSVSIKEPQPEAKRGRGRPRRMPPSDAAIRAELESRGQQRLGLDAQGEQQGGAA